MTVLTAEVAQKLINEQGRNVVIPDGITSIGDRAFRGKYLTSVEIPDSVTSIGDGAFDGNHLTSIDIPDNVITIGVNAFANNRLVTAEIGDSVTSIGDYAFNTNNLYSVAIGDSVTSIGKRAFSFNNLTRIRIPDSVISIGDFAFIRNRLTRANIPDNVTSIGEYAFAYNQLTSVDFPDTLTFIGSAAFISNQLTSVVIPDSVTSYIGGGAFKDNQLTSVVIGDNVTLIGSEAFANNQLTSVVIGESVTSIGDNAFIDNHLTSVEIPDSVTEIKRYAFCRNELTSVEIGEGVTGIWQGAFNGNQLTRVSIPDSVNYLHNDSFTGNPLEIVFLSKDERWDYIASTWFPDAKVVRRLGTQVLTQDLAQALVNEQGLTVVIPNDITSIGDNAFRGNQLTSIDIPDAVTEIGNFAFFDNNLTSVDLPGSLTSIGQYAFRSNELTSVDLPNSLTSIGWSAFSGNQLTSVEIPDSVTSIDTAAFASNQLESVDIPDSITSISWAAFANNQLTSVDIPDSVTEIGREAFKDNYLTSVGIPNSVTTIGRSAFWGNDLTNVEIGDGVTEIGNSAFFQNPLESASIPDSPDINDSNIFPTSTQITRRDINDAPTNISFINGQSLNENIAAGSIVARLRTIDQDSNDSFSYSLVDGESATDNALFTIDGDQLKINLSPDYETQDSYSARLRTTDSGGLTFEKSFTFTVNDLNEDPTNLSISASTFNENVTAGSAVANLSSTDPDSEDTHTYSLVAGDGDTDNNAFTAEGNKLLITSSPDYETQSSYSIRLRTTDTGGLTFEKSLTLSVNDIEELDFSKINLNDFDPSSLKDINIIPFDELGESIKNLNWSKINFDQLSLASIEKINWGKVNLLKAVASPTFRLEIVDWREINSLIYYNRIAAYSAIDWDKISIPEQILSLIDEHVINQIRSTYIDLTSHPSWNDSASVPLPIYAQPGGAADLITFDSLDDAHKRPGSKERAVFLSNDLELSGLGTELVPDTRRYGTSSDGVHAEGFAAAYGFFSQYTSDISFDIGGKNKFTDVITDAVTGGTSADGTLDLYLTNGSNGDAFFLHDAFSAYHKDVSTKKDAFGRDYAARIDNIKSIFAGDADDIIDLTTTESTNGISGGGVKTVYAGQGEDVVLGSTGTVYGEEGNDTLISHHSTVMSGGAGEDLFGFLATPAMQDAVTGVVSEPVHKILDFETGVDTIKFYISSDLESTGSMQTGNAGHITKTADGDIEWIYFHAGQTSKTMTVDMNGQSWSLDDIEFISYTSTTLPGHL